MERCVDCNSLLTKEEKVCIECGTTVGVTSAGFSGMLSGVASILFYVSLAALIASIFTARLSFVFCMLTTFALLFVMRTAKDGISKVKKR
jgi:uncharacterized membrane protein YtjA (UPF0391 family)